MSLKTNKALSKRVKITKNGKVLKRKAGQNHFNGRESGNTTRNKRRDVEAHETSEKTMKGLLPYHN